MHNEDEPPTSAEIYIAASRLRSIGLTTTPIITSSILNNLTGRKVYLKCENFQRTGSFKYRGALNAVLNAMKVDPDLKGFVTYSSGNHGLALSHAASTVNRPCVVVVPEGTPKNEIVTIGAYGGEVVICPPIVASRIETCVRISQERSLKIIPPNDHRDVIAGQGTVGVELIEQLADVDAIFVPVSGGGLISGIALYVKQINPNVRIFACVPEGKMLEECLRNGKRLSPEPTEFLKTKCESCRLPQCANIPFPIMCSLVEKQVFTISDSMMVDATRFAFERLKLVVELAAGLPLGALLFQNDRIDPNLKTIAVILCGGNIDLSLPLPWH